MVAKAREAVERVMAAAVMVEVAMDTAVKAVASEGVGVKVGVGMADGKRRRSIYMC